MIASVIGISSCIGEFVFITPSRAGSLSQAGTVCAEGDTGHLNGVCRSRSAERVGLSVFIQKSNLRKVQIKVSCFCRQIQCFEWATTFLMDDVEALDETQVIAHLVEGSRSTALVQVAAKGWPADR